MGSPIHLAVIIASYLYFVNACGQRWMKKRNAFDLNKVINVYNIVQILMNSYIFYMVREVKSFFEGFCFKKALILGGHRSTPARKL